MARSPGAATGCPGERFSRRRLLQDQFVVVHRKGHPAAKVQEFSTEKLATLPQLEISSAQFGPDFVEAGPGRSKPASRPAMRAPFLSAAEILATSDLVSVLPLNDASTFNNIRALSSRWAGLFPFRISASSRSRSSPLSRTTYFFTEISFAAMIASVACVATKANHQILSIWLKRPTSWKMRSSRAR